MSLRFPVYMETCCIVFVCLFYKKLPCIAEENAATQIKIKKCSVDDKTSCITFSIEENQQSH